MLFSVAAFGLAMVGIYGVVADWVGQRVPEIGIRMALGATTSNVLRMVMLHAAWMIAAGVTIGAAAALALHGLMSGFVFGVATTDPASYAFAILALVGTALAACLIPARRAARVDPAVALRRD
jgi:putative ABC transport system permease protein